MSPWNMMETWGVPSILLHAKAYEYADILRKKGKKVVDMAFAGGLAREDHIFKALALGAPFVKLACMGRALMIPWYLGSNIEGSLNPEAKDRVHGNWLKLPDSVTVFGSSPEQLFAGYYDLHKKVGKDEMKNIPLGAIALWTLADKLAAGLQQLMAGSRNFNLKTISRSDLMALTEEASKISGIAYVMDANRKEAEGVLEGKKSALDAYVKEPEFALAGSKK